MVGVVLVVVGMVVVMVVEVVVDVLVWCQRKYGGGVLLLLHRKQPYLSPSIPLWILCMYTSPVLQTQYCVQAAHCTTFPLHIDEIFQLCLHYISQLIAHFKPITLGSLLLRHLRISHVGKLCSILCIVCKSYKTLFNYVQLCSIVNVNACVHCSYCVHTSPSTHR